MLGGRAQAALGAAAVAVWVALLVWSRDTFIFHDSWKHQFPMLYGMTRDATCSAFPLWLAKVDSGSPMLIYTISTSAAQLLRVPMLYLFGCLQPELHTALYVYKAHIATLYLAFSAGMYVLGRVLFQRSVSALYLFVATLFAGLLLQALHSDQVVTILFWWPWIVGAVVLWRRHRSAPEGRWYLVGAVLCLCVQMLDQYPHFVVLPAAVGFAVAAWLWRDEATTHRSELLRLWPAVLIVLVTLAQLLIVKREIGDYVPSLRGSLRVDPRSFDETGFVQPTAIIGALLPVTFLERFEMLAEALSRWMSLHPWLIAPRVFRLRRGFMFQLDSVLFYLGFVPTVLAVAFAMRPGLRAIRLWWIVVAGAILAVSVQETGLYFLLVRMPLFDVFRSYALYIVFVVFALLIMSGYGLDAYLTLEPATRRRLLRQSLGVVLSLTALALVALLLLRRRGPTPWTALGVDAAIIAIGTVIVWMAAETKRPERLVVALIATLVVSQTAYFVAAHRLLGISGQQVVDHYGLDQDDLTPAPPTPSLVRHECHTFAQCYASRRDSVSLRTDLQGSFLRHRGEPLFQSGLDSAVVRALSGLTHPVFWFSRELVPYVDTADLTGRLNAARATIDETLRTVVYAPDRDVARLNATGAAARGDLDITALERRADHVRVRYEAATDGFLTASMTYDPGWVAQVNGQRVPVARAYYNGLVVAVPRGRGVIELAYESWPGRFFFAARYVELLVSLGVIAFVSAGALRRGAAESAAIGVAADLRASTSAAAPHG